MTDVDVNLDLLSVLNSHSDQIYAHSLAVSMFSIMIAKRLGFESNVILSKLSLAGLFHDIGKKEIDRNILEKERHLLTVEERHLYESHAIRGKDILNTVKTMSDDIVQLVYEHHEDPRGEGFPVGKGKKGLHPLTRIVYCANLFVENALPGPIKNRMTGPDTIRYLEKVYGDRIALDCLLALKQIFGMLEPN